MPRAANSTAVDCLLPATRRKPSLGFQEPAVSSVPNTSEGSDTEGIGPTSTMAAFLRCNHQVGGKSLRGYPHGSIIWGYPVTVSLLVIEICLVDWILLASESVQVGMPFGAFSPVAADVGLIVLQYS